MYRRTAHFNSRPHGGRRTSYTVSYECLKFQLTPSRRATIDKDVIIAYNIFQLTPSRRATQYDYQSDGNDQISTHALTEGDSGSPNHYADYTFQLTPSRRATQPYSTHFRILKFQLTPSRRATPGPGTHSPIPHHFNSRPHGGRLPIAHTRVKPNIFQLTPSRRATLLKSNFRSFSLISTHALTEGDKIHRCYMCLPRISTHALTEGDGTCIVPIYIELYFNSRPHGGRHCSRNGSDADFHISTHALTEGDKENLTVITTPKYFNSRPHGGRHLSGTGKDLCISISTHALTEGDTF